MPYASTRIFMLVLGFVTLATTFTSYILCIFVFGGLKESDNIRNILYISFIMKAFFWSPFIGMELYDMCFENIYYDVKFQLNVIKPDNTSQGASPSSDRSSK